MKKIVFAILAMFFIAAPWAVSQEDGPLKGIPNKGFPFYVYTDGFNRLNHYVPAGWMGDTGDLKYSANWAVNPKTGKTCIQIKYTAEKKQSAGWAGIYWQNPPNNWGTQKVGAGFDLTGATTLTFWARGEKGAEMVEFKLGGIAGEYSDSTTATTGPVELTKDWKLFTIDVSQEDMTFINGGFCLVFAADANPDGATVYLDEIVYNGKSPAAAPKVAETKTETKTETKIPKTK